MAKGCEKECAREMIWGVKKASIEEGAMGSLFVLVHRGL